MSEDKIKRRRFLADILFAGGAVSAAALLARAALPPKPEPQVAGKMMCPTPPQQPATPMVRGEAVLPQSTTPTPVPHDDTVLGGKVQMPQPPTLGGEPTLPATPKPDK